MDAQHMKAIAQAILQVGEPNSLEIAALIATILTVVAVALAAIYAGYQVRELRKANEESLKTEKARFLFMVDQMYEGAELSEARVLFYTKLIKIDKNVSETHTQKTLIERQKIIHDEFNTVLFKAREDKPEDYLKMLKLCGFFETVGVLHIAGYIELNAIVELYGISIIRVANAMETHIKKRWEEDRKLENEYMQNFLDLAKKVRASLSEREVERGKSRSTERPY